MKSGLIFIDFDALLRLQLDSGQLELFTMFVAINNKLIIDECVVIHIVCNDMGENMLIG